MFRAYIKESCNSNTKSGQYTLLVESPNGKKLVVKEHDQTTNYRLIMHAIIYLLEKMPQNYEAEIYTQTNWGLGKITDKEGNYKDVNKRTTNYDLAQQIKDLTVGKHLSITYLVDKKAIETKLETPKSHTPFIHINLKDNEDTYIKLSKIAKQQGISIETLSMNIINKFLQEQ